MCVSHQYICEYLCFCLCMSACLTIFEISSALTDGPVLANKVGEIFDSDDFCSFVFITHLYSLQLKILNRQRHRQIQFYCSYTIHICFVRVHSVYLLSANLLFSESFTLIKFIARYDIYKHRAYRRTNRNSQGRKRAHKYSQIYWWDTHIKKCGLITFVNLI